MVILASVAMRALFKGRELDGGGPTEGNNDHGPDPRF